jgi:excisionase family DNA binding protein
MAHFSLREAAGQCGVSKSTIHRAVRAGRLSASQTADGSLRIEAAELFRVFPPAKPETPLTRTTAHHAGQTATPAETGFDTAEATLLKAENAALQTSIAALKELSAELRSQRDAWQAQAERLALQRAEPPTKTFWQRLTG